MALTGYSDRLASCHGRLGWPPVGVMSYLSHPVVLQQSAVGGREEKSCAFFSELCCPFPQDELEHSLGESAAQGAAGVVLWVSWENTKTKVSSMSPGWGVRVGAGVELPG